MSHQPKCRADLSNVFPLGRSGYHPAETFTQKEQDSSPRLLMLVAYEDFVKMWKWMLSQEGI